MEYIPVDIAANAIIVIGWLTEAQYNDVKPTLSIFNLTSSEKSQMNYGRLLDLTMTAAVEFPFEKVFRYPKASATVNSFEYKMKSLLLEYLPFSIYDILTRGKGMNLRKLHQRQSTMFSVLKPIMMERFVFDSNRFQALRNFMNEADRKSFNISTDDIDWNFYIKDVVLGARRYLLKQKDDTLRDSRINLKAMMQIEKGFKIIILTIFVVSCCYLILKLNFKELFCSIC